MADSRYEICVTGRLSELACGAFPGMEVRPVSPRTVIFGTLAEPSDLRELLALCSAMGLELVSLRRLPASTGSAGRCSPGLDGTGAQAGDGYGDPVIRQHDCRGADGDRAGETRG
ncbi:MAG: hypothetical protein JWR81_6700 [Pseudonocardia sp.]|jgi:hypothetical protein|nr:hypothetical protein [Pseudonocardia sp.]